jgi:hypothetical protein
MSSPYFQGLDPMAAPSPVTPADSPSDAAGWAKVTPEGRGPADYDISAPQDIAGITGAFNAANAISAAGVLYPEGPRQREAQALLDSPAGAGEMSVLAGFPDYESSDVRPGPNMENPVQGQGGGYPGTTQGGVPQFMAGLGGGSGIQGVTPETGNMGDSSGGDYPGTTQDGVPKYGTS